MVFLLMGTVMIYAATFLGWPTYELEEPDISIVLVKFLYHRYVHQKSLQVDAWRANS